jgi:hypothetical protein
MLKAEFLLFPDCNSKNFLLLKLSKVTDFIMILAVSTRRNRQPVLSIEFLVWIYVILYSTSEGNIYVISQRIMRFKSRDFSTTIYTFICKQSKRTFRRTEIGKEIISNPP